MQREILKNGRFRGTGERGGRNCTTTHLGGEGEAEEESDEARAKSDGRLPGLEATRAKGHDAVDDAMPNGQLLGDAKRHQGKVEEDGPKRRKFGGPDDGHQGWKQFRRQSDRLVTRMVTRTVVTFTHSHSHHQIVVEFLLPE